MGGRVAKMVVVISKLLRTPPTLQAPVRPDCTPSTNGRRTKARAPDVIMHGGAKIPPPPPPHGAPQPAGTGTTRWAMATLPYERKASRLSKRARPCLQLRAARPAHHAGGGEALSSYQCGQQANVWQPVGFRAGGLSKKLANHTASLAGRPCERGLFQQDRWTLAAKGCALLNCPIGVPGCEQGSIDGLSIGPSRQRAWIPTPEPLCLCSHHAPSAHTAVSKRTPPKLAQPIPRSAWTATARRWWSVRQHAVSASGACLPLSVTEEPGSCVLSHLR